MGRHVTATALAPLQTCYHLLSIASPRVQLDRLLEGLERPVTLLGTLCLRQLKELLKPSECGIRVGVFQPCMKDIQYRSVAMVIERHTASVPNLCYCSTSFLS